MSLYERVVVEATDQQKPKPLVLYVDKGSKKIGIAKNSTLYVKEVEPLGAEYGHQCRVKVQNAHGGKMFTLYARFAKWLDNDQFNLGNGSGSDKITVVVRRREKMVESETARLYEARRRKWRPPEAWKGGPRNTEEKALADKARELGALAYGAGIKAPAQDINLEKLRRGNNVRDTTGAIILADAWHSGWQKAHRDAVGL